MQNQLVILFIGSNPSQKATSNSAFTEETKSGQILRTWIEGIDGTMVFDNITSQVTENNRPLNKEEKALAMASLQERIDRINPDRIVALGKAAAGVLKKLSKEFLEMPRPSGLNRKLNDYVFVAERCAALRAFCNA